MLRCVHKGGRSHVGLKPAGHGFWGNITGTFTLGQFHYIEHISKSNKTPNDIVSVMLGRNSQKDCVY